MGEVTGGLTITTGGLSVLAGGADLTGGLMLISTGGLCIKTGGGSVVAGGFTVDGGMTVGSDGVVVTAEAPESFLPWHVGHWWCYGVHTGGLITGGGLTL